MLGVRRREFITLLGGAAAWPLAARAQQGERVRLVGVLMNLGADDVEGQARLSALRHWLQELGWTEGRNIRIEPRWAAGNLSDARRYAAELVDLSPDVVFASAGFAARPLREATRSVPIVFVNVIDPVGSGIVESLAHPGGNATGFTQFDYGMSGKWLELLKEISPGIKRVAVIRDARVDTGIGQLAALQSVAPALGIELRPIGVRDAAEIERAFASLTQGPRSGLIVVGGAVAAVHRDSIVSSATRHRLPAVYPFRYFVSSGGLISYGPDAIDASRRAAGYVDRILKGENPANLPVQMPTKYELVINLPTARALGLEVPPTLLARADEVIE
jgi:putative ABC transport system substrate-binding protein